MGHAAREGALVVAVDRLRGSSDYPMRFVAAFGGRADSAVTSLRLRIALAAYLRSLQALESRFDRAVRGDTLALTTEERHGLTVFVGKGKCATCHFVPLFNGVTPPAFIEAEPEVIGAPSRATTSAGALDADVGRYAIDRIELHRHAFKTPTLRNVALTAPYMHNGAYRTLEQVVDFYDRGGGHGIGIVLDNQTLPTARLRLTPAERRDLVSFLRALTDTAGLTTRSGLGSSTSPAALLPMRPGLLRQHRIGHRGGAER
jgi:cytochrome c peroxidase